MIYRKTRDSAALYLDLTPYEYEQYVCDRLRNMGWTRTKVTEKSGDFGADIVGVSPTHKRVSIQVKQYKGSVGIDGVKEALAGKAYYRCSGSMVITTGPSFTSSAVELARSSGTWLWPNFEEHRHLSDAFGDAQSRALETVFAGLSQQRHMFLGRTSEGWQRLDIDSLSGVSCVGDTWLLMTCDGSIHELSDYDAIVVDNGQLDRRQTRKQVQPQPRKVIRPNAVSGNPRSFEVPVNFGTEDADATRRFLDRLLTAM